jgi:hypothetical protein
MVAKLRPRFAGLLLTVLAVAGAACSTPTASSSGSAPPASGGIGGGDAAAEAYCTSKGGTVVTRVPTWNTNADPQAWLTLGVPRQLCEFESTVPGDQAATRISVDLVTLSSAQPTIAAIAYLSKVPPLLPDEPSMNPARYNCIEQLGGAADWGNTDVAGGWVDAGQPVFVVMDLCVFADGSAIDQFGIFYYATGAIRGADLAPLFAYQPGDTFPAMFERIRRP